MDSTVAEFDLIERIRRRVATRGDVVLGIGDDAALLQVPAGMQLVVAMDTLNSGVHFPPETAPADTARYLLQAGAFERAADAENLKARIALAGEAARVETADVGGKTLHRVRLGPYTGEKVAAAAKRALAEQGIATVSIKLP